MITRTVKIQLLAFATVTAVGVSYVGAQYTGIGDALLDRGYTVRAEFAESGGIFQGAEVTYRGVPVGRVGQLELMRLRRGVGGARHRGRGADSGGHACGGGAPFGGR